MRSLIIGVIGDSEADPPTLSLAYEVGTCIAKNNAILVCGGLGGVMQEACRGAKAHGGTTIGVLPGKDRTHCNPYVDIPITTGLEEGRNLVIVNTADGLIAIRGGYGTLTELAFALKIGKPVVGLHTWKLIKEGISKDHFPAKTTAQEAVEQILILTRQHV